MSGSVSSHLSASPGFTFRCSSRVRSASNRSSPIRSDWASIPTRGSRFVGLFSMSMTKASGLTGLEQEAASSRATRTTLQSFVVGSDARAPSYEPHPNVSFVMVNNAPGMLLPKCGTVTLI